MWLNCAVRKGQQQSGGMPDMPFVSLIIPVYNAEKYLRRCLNSAMEQTFQDMEIIVVNDGSQDTSLEICREYEKMDRRFRVINKENTGVSDSRNQAIETARGEYLQFMDSDDWLTQDATESFVHAARNSTATWWFQTFTVLTGLCLRKSSTYVNGVFLPGPSMRNI